MALPGNTLLPDEILKIIFSKYSVDYFMRRLLPVHMPQHYPVPRRIVIPFKRPISTEYTVPDYTVDITIIE